MAGKILSLDVVRGTIGGLIGTALGMGITVLVRLALNLPPWSPGPVYTAGMITGIIGWVISLGVLKHWFRWATGAAVLKEEPRSGYAWPRFFNVDTNHKIIGIQYTVTGLAFLPFAVILQLIGRTELSKLVPSFIDATAYESIISDHGIVMLFIVVLPVLSGLMNYLVPLLIGARDMAFPRLNAFSYWLVPPAGLLAVFSLVAGGFQTGWTVYPPLSSNFQPLGMNMILLAIYIGGLSSILTAVNVLTTVFTMRARGMTAFRMPIFVWTALATTGLSLVFTQFVAISFLMVLLERTMHMGFFDPAMGGFPLLYQYLFWFYSHPAVYIFILPGLGIISEVMPVFTRVPLFGYRMVAMSSIGIALGGVFVFGHHMFASGMAPFLRVPFMITTLLVAVPTGIKIFSWLGTMWMGKIRLRTPLLFILSSIFIFLIGGLTGVPLGIVPVDLYVHDTYYVVGHFHATLFGGFLLPVMAGIYYWFPKASGRMLKDRLGRIQWLLMTVGSILLTLPMIEMGLLGMRRRVEDYALTDGLQALHVTTAIGGFLVFAGIVILIYNIVISMRRGKLAGKNPWGGHAMLWMIPSPPPEENFEDIPIVVGNPYSYGEPGVVHAIMKGRTSTGESTLESPED